MNKVIAIAFVVVGVVLLCLGYNSYHSAASGVSRVFTGASTNKTIWLVIGGVVATLAGLGGLLTGPKKI